LTGVRLGEEPALGRHGASWGRLIPGSGGAGWSVGCVGH
jgi:hypothetical protein